MRHLKKEIKKEDANFSVAFRDPGPAHFISRTICAKCGKPIMALLKKHKIDDGRTASAGNW